VPAAENAWRRTSQSKTKRARSTQKSEILIPPGAMLPNLEVAFV